MLKIKDSVDVKELEKFGFKPRYDEDTGNIVSYIKYVDRFEEIRVVKRKIFRIFKAPTKKIEWRIQSYLEYFDVDTLYDLIQNGLVEKIKEN